nr:dna replication licensing factor mcm4 [Quercus suber]
MLREASIEVKQYMVSTPTSTDDPRENEIAIKRVIEIEGESLDVNSRDVFGYDPDLYTKMLSPLFEKHIQTRIFNLKSSTSMRNLNPSDVERMVSLKDPVVINRGQITEPKICLKEECQARDSMTLVHNRCR